VLLGVVLLSAARIRAADPAPTTAPAPTRLAPAQVEALLVHLEHELESVKTLRLDFEQEKHLALLADVVHAKGVCLFVRPSTIRFEIVEPFQSVLIARDRSVAKFEQLDGQWQKLKLPNTDVVLMITAEMASWLQGSFRRASNIYEIAVLEGPTTAIVLTPRAEGMRKHITAIELQLADDRSRVVQVIVREPGGDFTRIAFVRERRNTPLGDALFDTAGSAPAPLPAASDPRSPAPGGG
jgi:hypothetical protein